MRPDDRRKRIFVVMADVELIAEFADSVPIEPCIAMVKGFTKSVPRRETTPAIADRRQIHAN